MQTTDMPLLSSIRSKFYIFQGPEVVRSLVSCSFLIQATVINWLKISNKDSRYFGEHPESDKHYFNLCNQILIQDQGHSDKLSSLNGDQIIHNATIEFPTEIEDAKEKYELVKKHITTIQTQIHASPIDYESLVLSLKNAKEDCNSIKKNYKKLNKEARKKMAQERANILKLDGDVLKYAKVVGILLPIFTVTGNFIYQWNLLRFFEIQSSHYFTLLDYLQLNLNVIFKAFLYTGLSLVCLYYFLSGRVRMHAHTKEKDDRIFDLFIMPIILIITISVFGVSIYYTNYYLIYNAAEILVIILLPVIINYFFKPNIHIFMFFYIFILFAGSIFSQSYVNYKQIISSQGKTWQITTNNETHNQLSLITQNFSYYFFYNKKNKSILIQPKDKIEKISEI